MADDDNAGEKRQVPLRKRAVPNVGPGNEPTAPLAPEDAVQEGENTVLMIFKKEVLLTTDDKKHVRFPMGLVAVPAHLADHWYLAANGVRRAQKADVAQPREED